MNDAPFRRFLALAKQQRDTLTSGERVILSRRRMSRFWKIFPEGRHLACPQAREDEANEQ
jgi:hypothetical protein